MTIGLKFATLVMAVTSLIVSGILAVADSIPTTAQGPSSNLPGDVTSSLQSAKMHLTEATKNIKMGDSQGSINANKYDSSSDNVSGIKI